MEFSEKRKYEDWSLSRSEALPVLRRGGKAADQAFAVMEYFGYLRRDPDAFYLDWIS